MDIKRNQQLFQIKTHFVVRFIARMIRVSVLCVYMVYFCFISWFTRKPSQELISLHQSIMMPCRERGKCRERESVQKCMWWPKWSWINSRKRKQKADKVNEQRSHINRTFKLINREECILWVFYTIYLCMRVCVKWCDALLCNAML